MYFRHGYFQMTEPFVPMTKEAVAAVLECTTRTIENMVNSGELPRPIRIAGRAFWHPEVFYAWLDSLLRGELVGVESDVLPAVVSAAENKKLSKPSRPSSGGAVTDPAARMKARQAALMAST
jgi:predicted DNA-binding transcriptional regulator AlpA